MSRKNTHRNWTKEEIDIIKNKYNELGAKQLSFLLQRPVQSVYAYASKRLKIKKNIFVSGNSQYKNGKTKTNTGYIYLNCAHDYPYTKNGRILEHNYIWWKHHPEDIITKDDCVHHINGKRSDNRIENLCKMKKSEHTILHNKIRWRNKYVPKLD